MGKTAKPLTIIALPPCDGWEELKKLEAQGHRIIRVTEDADYLNVGFLLDADLVIGGNCWRLTGIHARYLPIAIKEARMLRYNTKEERADAKNRRNAGSDIDNNGMRDTAESIDPD